MNVSIASLSDTLPVDAAISQQGQSSQSHVSFSFNSGGLNLKNQTTLNHNNPYYIES